MQDSSRFSLVRHVIESIRNGERVLAATALAIGALAVLAPPAHAAETANSEFVIIREDDVLSDDLYAGAVKVVVDGELDGDLIAFTAEEVVINGRVTGSVFAVSPTVAINGIVDGSVRMAGNSLSVNGSVGGDVVAAAVSIELDESSTVDREVLAWSVSIRSAGSVGELSGGQRTLELGGEVEGDVDVSVGRLRIIGPLTVGGDLGYRSENEAEGLDQATVEGVIVHKAPLPPNIRVRALSLFARFLVILFLTIAALTVAWGWPDRTSRAVRDLRSSPLRSWAFGALIVFSPVILVGIAAIIFALAPPAASFPLLAIFAPLVLTAIGLVGALALIAGVPAVGLIGSMISRRLGLYGAVLTGSVLVGLAWLLPLIGWAVPVVVMPLGLGAWLLGWRDETPDRPTRLETV